MKAVLLRLPSLSGLKGASTHLAMTRTRVATSLALFATAWVSRAGAGVVTAGELLLAVCGPCPPEL